MATRNIVPRADGEGKLGTTAKKWGEVNTGSVLADSVTATGSIAAKGITTRQNSTLYAVDDVAFSASLPGKMMLVCTTAGTTAATEPDFSGATIGGTVTDGTAVWTYMPLGTLSREITPAFNHRDVITTSGTYTAPVTGWYKITVKGGGGGGAGGSKTTAMSTTGGGGGEGGTTIAYEYMTAGQTATVTIGAGGAGGAGSYTGSTVLGSPGGDSSVIVNQTTYIGYGAQGGAGNGGQGGGGTIRGACGGATVKLPTANLTGGIYSAPGGGSGGSILGNTSTQGGGGAGGNVDGNGSYAGGTGGAGFVWFEYFAAV